MTGAVDEKHVLIRLLEQIGVPFEYTKPLATNRVCVCVQQSITSPSSGAKDQKEKRGAEEREWQIELIND